MRVKKREVGKRLALSVSQMPRAAACTMSLARPSRLSRPPASLLKMYASGAGLAASSSAWAEKMAHWQVLLHYVSKKPQVLLKGQEKTGSPHVQIYLYIQGGMFVLDKDVFNIR